MVAMTRSYPDRPYVGIGVAVFRPGHVLLIRRGKPPRLGEWSLPGGAQELGETVVDAARREVMEETGVAIDDLKLVDVIDSIRHDTEARVKFHFTLIDFAARWVEGEPIAGTDAMHAEWIPLEHAPTLGMWRETNRVIEVGQRLVLGG